MIAAPWKSKISWERLERVLIGLAEIIERYPELRPLLGRLEKDYAVLRRPSDAKRGNN